VDDPDYKLLGALNVPVALLSDSGVFIFVNRAFLELAETEALPQESASVKTFFCDTLPLQEGMALSRSVSGGIPCRVEFKNKKGPTRLSIHYLVEKGGKETFLLQGRQRNIDDFIGLNREIQELDHSLAKEATLTRRHKATVDGIEQFTQKLIHDIRSPLGSVVAFSRLAREEVECGEYKSLLSFLELAEDASRSLLELTDRLYEDLQAKQSTLEIESVLLNEVVDALRRDLKVALEDVGAQLCLDDPEFALDADPLLLKQCLQNLVQNSIKFRSPDRPLEIRIGVVGNKERGELLCVNDNGIGFDQKSADALFERFYRLNLKDSDGLGLGLSTCRHIVELHGWKISAMGKPGQGATFKIALNSHAPR